MNLSYKNPLNNNRMIRSFSDINHSLNQKCDLFGYIKAEEYPNFHSIQEIINHFKGRIKQHFEERGDEDFSNEHFLTQLAYFCLYQYISENSNIIPSLIPKDFRGFDIPENSNLPLTTNLFEASPETLAILYFVKLQNSRERKSRRNMFFRKFLFSFYTKVFQI
ncbi:hypothetical protein TRFO_41866 [Tritrichomonas foetus]|uniref:Uncharacterized protein n=1 Tax=Tritrichomonas foetus TaxID=1144522 RepID=A0A1J4KYU7_9EUKA|nr:hypothetical protein TRFO_41866 [Tritrichomonas foetus]|eukprot:OHT16330.1 hypothetical protein TRFO_41866 [Tritrichomonas foetus]